MKLSATLFILLLSIQLLAQSTCPSPTALSRIEGNNISATITNGGDLFWNGATGQFYVPVNDPTPTSTIFATGLWMGGIDPAGNLKVAAQTYGRSIGAEDYVAGPLNDTGQIFEGLCAEFDTIWKVTKEDVDIHLADFQDNGVVDNPVPSIFGWPGKGNAFFVQFNSFSWPAEASTTAPFFDRNGNGVYQPDEGDFPFYGASSKYPTQMTWTVFNDAGTIHNSSYGDPLQVDIGLITWAYECDNKDLLNNTIFASYTITNKSIESIDSFYIGLWVDFDLGCFRDDYIGSAPDKNAFFVYNQDNLDGLTSANDCEGVPTYGENPPVQSVTFLNRSLDNFIYYKEESAIINSPDIAPEYYNYLSGRWRDGTPLTIGGSGYNPNSTAYTHHAFPDAPNDPNGWSMAQEETPTNFHKVIGSYYVDRIDPGRSTFIDIAFTYHRKEGFSNLENVTQMYTDIDKIQDSYDFDYFEQECDDPVVTSTLISASTYRLSPNPSTGQFNLELNDLKIDQLNVFDLAGKIWQQQSNLSGRTTLDLSHLPAGMYVLEMKNKSERALDKLVIIK